MGTDFSSNRAAWLVAGFLGRKVMKDIMGRWSLIPVLAVGLCVWTRWKSRQEEGRAERGKLEEIRRSTRLQLRSLSSRKSTLTGGPSPQGPRKLTTRGSSIFDSSSGSEVATSANTPKIPTSGGGHPSAAGRRPGDRLGGIPSSSIAASAMNHGLPKTTTVLATSSAGTSAKDTALATSEWWAWLGVGGGASRGAAGVCAADRGSRSRGGGGGGGEWRGAFTNRMGGVPRRNAFKTARGKVYLRSGSRRPGWGRQSNTSSTFGGLESVREEEEGA